MRTRREFMQLLGGAGMASAWPGVLRRLPGIALASFLVPMDEAQTDHLKAYGLAFRALERGEEGEWLLNYRGGSFLLPATEAVRRDAALSGVVVAPVSAMEVAGLHAEILRSNADAVPLEKVPKVAVYAPPNAAPWDDAVTMVLEYAGIRYDRIWDVEVMADRLDDWDWLHLHHEDFTGQYSKFVINNAGAPWLQQMITLQQSTATRLGMANVPALKRAVAQRIAGFVDRGGFLFAMCTATETLDLALASAGTDIAAAYADGTPMDPAAGSRMQWDKTLAFTDATLEQSPSLAVFSDIDGHQVNGINRQPLGAFSLFNFSAKIDPVPTMLVQNHRDVISDFYGLTTSFMRNRIKPGVTILGDELGAPWAKYLHGEHGQGTWTFYGGHDPEDPQHGIGDA
ncbi:MAG: asparagine synthetase B, partial [Gemmatimonadota bacterium]